LHDELHHADHRDHWPAHWVGKGGNDHSACLHLVPVARR
jgi:hypothetical protein